ncbi:MAG: SARP family transcriptional regulator [Pseudonocardiaceae bacterium]|nr:SARP family transcriptional regulator [Pseudonocardiaceae bacterium]
MSPISFRVLGPLEVNVAGRALPLGGPKPRMLLATLVLQSNVPVSTDALVDVLWPRRAPPSATANIRTYVHSLRRCLADGGSELADRLCSKPSGYLLATEPGELDMALFETRVAEAKQAHARREPEAALELLRLAGGLWRGEVLEDLPHSHGWEATVARLDELRLSVREQQTKIQIDLGRHDEAIVELRGLLAEHPLREELWQRLIDALVAGRRTAEALNAYAEVEQVLLDELDAEPGPELQRVRARLFGPSPVDPFPVSQLPLDPPDFTGRSDTVAELEPLLREQGRDGTPTVAVLSGAPGVGKSAIAVHVAHAVRSAFPDGQLHVDLRGTSATPRAPGDVLAELLRSLGVPDAGMPRELTERAALLRSRLASRRVCIVLDDASGAAQVRPLLPGTGGCAMLITSRVRMPQLAGTRSVHVDVLGESEAVRLLGTIVGHRRTSAEPEAAASIVRSCGGLPLAIRVIGAKLADRAGCALGALAERLLDERRRLDELRIGDLEVRASVTLSYDLLPADAARAFRWLGVLGSVQFPGWVVAALLDRPEADHVQDALVDASLVELVGSDALGRPRYRLHDLLRCHAAERAALDGESERRSAIRRVLEGYLHHATAAVREMPSHFFGVAEVGPPAGSWCPGKHDGSPADPVGWFEAEAGTAVAAISLARQWGLDELAWRLTAAFTPYFDLRGHRENWRDTHDIALAAARRADDAYGEAVVLRNLGQLHVYRDRYADALATFRRSERLFRQVGDDRGTAIALAGSGSVLRLLGEHQLALDGCHQSLSLFADIGDRHGEAVAKLSIGAVWLARGWHSSAEAWFSDAYQLCAAIGDRHREAHASKRLAILHQHRGDLGAAREHLDRAIAIFDDLGDDHCAGYAHQNLGELCLRSGELAHAQLLLVNSLRVHHRNGDRRCEAEAAELLGQLHQLLSQPERSHAYRQRARTLWDQLSGDQPEQARRSAPA